MATSLLDFASGAALGAASTDKYGTKATPVSADLLLIGDSADSNESKYITFASIEAVDTSITTGTLATATNARVANFGSHLLTLDSITTLDVNHTGLAEFQSDTGVQLSGASASQPGKLLIADNDSSHKATIKGPATITANYDIVLLSTLPASEKILTIDNTGQLSTTDIIDIDSRYRGGHDASNNDYPEVGGAGPPHPPEIDPLATIEAGDFFDIAVAGNLGGTPVNKLDRLYAKVQTPGQTSTNWGIITAPTGSSDTSITAGVLASAAADRSVPFNNKNVTLDAMASLTMNSTGTVKITSDSGLMLDGSSGGTPGKLLLNDPDDSNTVTIQPHATTANNYVLKLFDDVPGSGTLMVTIDSTGQLAHQAIPAGGGGTDTHIFDDTLANQAADANHNQAGFKVTFTQNTAGSGMKWNNATDGFGVKDGVPRLINTGDANEWWTFSISSLGEFVSTDTGSTTF